MLALPAAGLAASCGSDTEPAAVDVRVTYVSRLPAGVTAALEFTVTGSGAIRQ
jgi:hypothetical protein